MLSVCFPLLECSICMPGVRNILYMYALLLRVCVNIAATAFDNNSCGENRLILKCVCYTIAEIVCNIHTMG
jgi:hypothetical protein